MALTATSRGRVLGSRRSRSIRTEVSMMPRGGRTWSAMRSRILRAHAVEILTKLRIIDAGCLAEDGNGRVGLHVPMPTKRGELPDGHSISGHHEGLAVVETSHNFTALVAQLSLTYLPHPANVAHGATLG